jgi:Skp family chaperone for outer membrane proteins
MRIDRILMVVAAVALASTPSAGLHAQTASTAQQLGGPVIPGLCVLSGGFVFAHAKVGVAASARLKQLADQAQSEIDAERKPLDADVQTYRSQAASLTPDQRQAREQALGARMQQLQAGQQLRARELEATRAKAMEQIQQQAQPVIASVYNSRNCGMLLDRSVVLGGNMTNDITSAVVQGLDAKVTTMSFNMETLPASSTPSTSP